MAIGTPMPSTLAWTAIRSSTGTNWKITLIDPRVTPSLNERSTIRAETTSVNKSSDDAPGPSVAASIAIVRTVTTAGLATRPTRSPKRIKSHAASRRNAMSTALSRPV